jgi:hypothetical protein
LAPDNLLGPADLNRYIEALQISNRQTQTDIRAGNAFWRVGSDVVNLKELDDEESDNLAFAQKLHVLSPGEDPIYYGPSSGAALIKNAMEYKSTFAESSLDIPVPRQDRFQSDDFEVRASLSIGNVVSIKFESNFQRLQGSQPQPSNFPIMTY